MSYPRSRLGTTADFKATYCVRLPRPLTHKIKSQIHVQYEITALKIQISTHSHFISRNFNQPSFCKGRLSNTVDITPIGVKIRNSWLYYSTNSPSLPYQYYTMSTGQYAVTRLSSISSNASTGTFKLSAKRLRMSPLIRFSSFMVKLHRGEKLLSIDSSFSMRRNYPVAVYYIHL